MLLTPASAPLNDDVPSAAEAADGETIARELAAKVRSAFPDLSFSRATVEERGGDHRVLLLDGTYAFRFPREKTRDLALEIAVLHALRGRCDIAVPDYGFIDPAGCFAGYRFIAGDELTPRRFALLPKAARDDVLDQAGHFLAVLHGLSPAEIAPDARWPKLPTVASQIAHASEHRLPTIAGAFPDLADLVAGFYDGCEGDMTGRQVILHGDLVDDHILLAPDGRSLAGIIDFGDVTLGDPAQDLLGFWAYGGDAVTRVIVAYDAGADRALGERSRQAFVRYRIDRFVDLLASDGRAAAVQSLPALMALLSQPERS